MSTVLKAYTSSAANAEPHFTFESKVGPFMLNNGLITSQTYDGREVVWLVYDFESNCWYCDLERIGIFDPDVDEQRVYIYRFTIEDKGSFTQPIVPELTPSLVEKLDHIDLKISLVLNRMDEEKEREELAPGRMSRLLHGNLDVETAINDILEEYQNTVVLEPERTL